MIWTKGEDRRYDVALYAPWVAPRLAAEHGARGSRPGLGGAETQLMLLAGALAEHGLRVCMLVYELPGVEIPARVDGVDVIVRPFHEPGGGLAARLREVLSVRRAVREANSRVVITRGAGYDVGVLGFWSKLSRCRFVFASASLGDFRYEHVLPNRRDRLLFRLGVALADRIVVQTEEQVALCRTRFRRTPALIRSVAELGRASGGEREAFLWVGRAEPNKQPHVYIELARALPDARFWIVARRIDTSESGQLWAEIEQGAADLSNLELLEPRPRPQLLELMSRAVAVVSTSGFEGMPNIFLEAWAHGTPALALNHDPDGIITRHGLGGFAHGEEQELVRLAAELWAERRANGHRAEHYRRYIETHHAPAAVGAAWARELRLEDS